MRTVAIVGLALAIASVLVSIPARARADDVSHAATPAEVIEARAQIDATIAQMRATSLRVREQLRNTRKRGTRQQNACVDQALSRSDVSVRRARETADDVLAAYQRGDVDGARALRTRLGEIRDTQRQAAAEGTSCSPAFVVASASATTVKLSVDPRIPAPAP